MPLDATSHDVAGFSSGVTTCDEDLRAQARKPRNRCLVMAEGRRILAYGRYVHAQAGPDNDIRPCVRIDFVARDVTADPGTGTAFMLRLLSRIARDPKASAAKGILIDSMDHGDPDIRARRWRFFTQKLGFTPLRDDGRQHGYAFMPMATVREIAATADGTAFD